MVFKLYHYLFVAHKILVVLLYIILSHIAAVVL